MSSEIYIRWRVQNLEKIHRQLKIELEKEREHQAELFRQMTGNINSIIGKINVAKADSASTENASAVRFEKISNISDYDTDEIITTGVSERLESVQVESDGSDERRLAVIDWSTILDEFEAKTSDKVMKFTYAQEISVQLATTVLESDDDNKAQNDFVSYLNNLLNDDELDYEFFKELVDRHFGLLKKKIYMLETADITEEVIEYYALCELLGVKPKKIKKENIKAESKKLLQRYTDKKKEDYVYQNLMLVFAELSMSVVDEMELDGLWGHKVVDETLQNCSIFMSMDGEGIVFETVAEVDNPDSLSFDQKAIIAANTTISSPDALSENELECLTRLFLSSKKRKQSISSKNCHLLTNLIFYIVEKINDLPAWFYINNPFIKNVSISKPIKELRRSYISSNMSVFYDNESLSGEEFQKAIDEISNLTEGFSNVDVFGVLSLCEQRGISAKKVRKAINLFKYGETESHWDKLDHSIIENADMILTKRVKGQPKAISKVVDILGRACSGMSGIQGSTTGKPKGILFFAGPTGTGKTELAKAIAELIFGDESFVTRFDMSEYQQSHTDQKLLGAPPGYIGYGAGGQLTNAVKEKPFSVLLFDEIDKADPSILDKFLQILEDGRMTDSTGETVYFSETLIIFTSNLGMIDIDSTNGNRFHNISIDMPYSEIEEKVLTSIKNFFCIRIGRPELLNRIGNNFIVFDFIREDVVDEILLGQVSQIKKNLLNEKNITLELSSEYYTQLHMKASSSLINGGRGIGNTVESVLINPLSRIFVMKYIEKGARVTIIGLNADGTLVYSVETGDEANVE